MAAAIFWKMLCRFYFCSGHPEMAGRSKKFHKCQWPAPFPGYMQNLVTELSCVFNFTVRFYGLSLNPCRVAGNAVGQKQKSLNFWTKEEFDRFIDTFEHSDSYYTAFLILYYCGLKIGELEALTFADIDHKGNTIAINKTYHLINGEGIVTTPKTAKANRTIIIPAFLSECIQRYKGMTTVLHQRKGGSWPPILLMPGN